MNIAKKHATRIASLFNQIQVADMMSRGDGTPDLWEGSRREAYIALGKYGIFLPAYDIVVGKPPVSQHA